MVTLEKPKKHFEEASQEEDGLEFIACLEEDESVLAAHHLYFYLELPETSSRIWIIFYYVSFVDKRGGAAPLHVTEPTLPSMELGNEERGGNNFLGDGRGRTRHHGGHFSHANGRGCSG